MSFGPDAPPLPNCAETKDNLISFKAQNVHEDIYDNGTSDIIKDTTCIEPNGKLEDIVFE